MLPRNWKFLHLKTIEDLRQELDKSQASLDERVQKARVSSSHEIAQLKNIIRGLRRKLMMMKSKILKKLSGLEEQRKES